VVDGTCRPALRSSAAVLGERLRGVPGEVRLVSVRQMCFQNDVDVLIQTKRIPPIDRVTPAEGVSVPHVLRVAPDPYRIAVDEPSLLGVEVPIPEVIEPYYFLRASGGRVVRGVR